jgi:glycosyltransferase involved in cell wall biosynthesis
VTQLSIIVPCYNEAGNLEKLFARFREVLSGREGVEVLLVNNGSKDDSAAIFAREVAKPEHHQIRVVDVPVNQGYGYGILQGLKAAQGDYLGWTHADLQTDPKDVFIGFDKLLQQQEPHKCILRGRRSGRGMLDVFFTWGMGLIASWLLKTRLADINAQPKIFHRSFYDSWVEPPYDFSLDLFALYRAKQKGLQFIEQTVKFPPRKAGEAKGGGSLKGKYKLTKRTLNYMRELSRKVKK